MGKTRLIAFDLDGTLTQHKTPLAQPNLGVLDSLGEKYKLLMVGAGMCSRIFRQMNGCPIDIIGNYGMQFCTYNAETKALDKVFDMHAPCDRESVERRITALRERIGYTEYTGDNVEYHDSDCVTFPLLGTKADIAAKLAFDPDRSKRKPLYPAVRDAFPDYTVFIGGSSSFDFAPFPYNKYYSLDKYCAEYGYSHDEVVYVGDDYGPGGNDEAVYLSDFTFVRVDDYTRFGEYMREYL